MSDTLLQITRQESIESRYSRKHIDGYIKEFVETDSVVQAKIEQGVELLNQWLSGTYYESKMLRLEQVKQLDLTELVTKLFVGIAYVTQPELFTSVTSKLSSRLGFDDKRDAIATVAEIMTVLCATDAYDITKADKFASLMVVSRMSLPAQLVEYIEQSMYMPPMVCEPLELRSNYDSGYLGHKESVILGNGNHHNGNVCLDVINKVNRVRLKLDTDFLLSVEEDPAKEFTVENAHAAALKKGKLLTEADAKAIVQSQWANWARFKPQSAKVYMLLHECDNEFYLTHKVDKRGRLYAQGYHVSTQGASYKKAMVEFAKQELVTGVPT